MSGKSRPKTPEANRRAQAASNERMKARGGMRFNVVFRDADERGHFDALCDAFVMSGNALIHHLLNSLSPSDAKISKPREGPRIRVEDSR